MFKTAGPLEKLDPANERYRGELKREFRERVRAGEMPNRVIDQIREREQKTPLAPEALPTPLFLKGAKDDLTSLEQAAQITAQKYQTGEIDAATAKRERVNIIRLQESIRHHQQLEQKDSKNNKQKKSSSEKYL